MKRGVVITAIACLLVGVAGGYGTGYAVYEPQIRDYQAQVSNLTSEVSTLSQIVSSQETRILALESDKSALQLEMSRLQAEKSRLESDLATAQQTITSYEKQTSDLRQRVSSLEDRTNRILDIKVTQHYDWSYQGKGWKWDLPISLSLYVEYLERPRPTSAASFIDMAKDPKDDIYIDQMTQRINTASMEEGFTEFEKVNFVIAFVQSLPYTVDIETTPYNNYPRYPVETLFDRGGDCEDTSILVAALLDRLGYDVALLHLQGAKHMAVGISLTAAYGSYYEYGGKKYFYLETTGEGWQVGKIPPDITDTKAHIYPLRS